MNVNDYRVFDEMAKSIQRLGEKWRDATKNKDEITTYAGVQKQMKTLRFFISNEKADIARDIKKLSNTWHPKVIEEKRAKLYDELNGFIAKIISEQKQCIRDLATHKKEKIADMLAAPPSASQLRLLEALQMRDDLDVVELNTILPTFFDNYLSMKVLQNIGKKQGFTISMPIQMDCREMFNNIEKATNYLLRACEELPKSKDKMDLTYKAFYTENPDAPDMNYDPQFAKFVEMFDTVPQLLDCKTTKTELSPTERVQLEYYYKDLIELDMTDNVNKIKVLKRTKEVIDKHPESVPMLSLSPYAEYVQEVIDMNARGTEQ